MDKISPSRRSWNMSRIRSSNTAPEVMLRKALFAVGFRFRVNVKSLPGKPDIVFPARKKVIFVHGCFWHMHRKRGCSIARFPKTRKQYWLIKLIGNSKRDEINEDNLRAAGWKYLVLWECEIEHCSSAVNKAIRFLD